MRRVVLATVCLLVASAHVRGADDEKAESKLEPGKLAAAVNFSKELGLQLSYLSSIGREIDQARLTPDPVALWTAAQALGAAEKASGKKASITADTLRKEAVDLAQMRGYSGELAVVAELVTDKAAKEGLQKSLADAEKRDAAAKKALASGEKQKELFDTLTVANHSGECLRIFVSGRYVGEAHQGQTTSFYVHDHNNPTTLTAVCEQDGDVVSHRHIFGHQHGFYWHIH
jgi:hypothetical protein